MSYESLPIDERRRRWREASRRYQLRFVAYREAKQAAKWASRVYKPRGDTYAIGDFAGRLVTINGRSYILMNDRLGDTGVFTPHKCAACGCTCNGLERIYPLREAFQLVPMPSEVALRKWLHDHASLVGSPLYKVKRGRRERWLTGTDIARIQAHYFMPRNGRASPLTQVIRQANKLDAADVTRRVLLETFHDGEGEAT